MLRCGRFGPHYLTSADGTDHGPPKDRSNVHSDFVAQKEWDILGSVVPFVCTTRGSDDAAPAAKLRDSQENACFLLRIGGKGCEGDGRAHSLGMNAHAICALNIANIDLEHGKHRV